MNALTNTDCGYIYMTLFMMDTVLSSQYVNFDNAWESSIVYTKWYKGKASYERTNYQTEEEHTI